MGFSISGPFPFFMNDEWERSIVLRFGSYTRSRSSGIHFKIPFIEKPVTVPVYEDSVDVMKQEAITRDNVPVEVDGVVFFEVKDNTEDVKDAIVNVGDYKRQTLNYATSILRDQVGKKELDDLLQRRDEIGDEIQQQLDDKTDSFGVNVLDVEIQNINLPEKMERAMAAQAEAERDRRARRTNAQGELEAAVKLRQASEIIGDKGYRMRTLQTLDSVAAENSTIVTFPTELIGGMSSGESETGLKEILDNVSDLDLSEYDIGDVAENLKDGDIDIR
ncbi:SPFH domain-containing protein [Candidatus Nanohalobium constans]|uniref:Membrane protease, stomatin/prohibitin family n=1 Tax=Candidatus Nanohalobium constans TaxID=2565781 RepID=A0A5Q0UG42_9ARCH|nr:SPFH domain-containing protein [Candidatus Nanohalobium constans]QGA80588.1 membrane protease, stomatin/prohibitin family [Candidatus Nanohalobium constans]